MRTFVREFFGVLGAGLIATAATAFAVTLIAGVLLAFTAPVWVTVLLLAVWVL